MSILSSRLRTSAWAVLWLAALCSLLLVLFSPFVSILDHHWIERVPTHTHMTLDGTLGAASPHRHVYEETHWHTAQQRPLVVNFQAALFDFDGGQPSVALGLPTQPVASDFSRAEPPVSAFGVPLHIADGVLSSLSVPPDLRPPRVVA